ncbi:polysaccharide deacetylase family protein [Fictibacillus nanhaiensis]|nr:polysaccharide deacetylase family protein [Fictibacillus nanhaiensis]
MWTNKRKWADHSNSKSLILTFDDGPSSVLIPILDILKRHEAKAMFFWQSRLLHKQRPWKRVVEEGHIIGGHSLRHRDLTRLSLEKQHHDIKSNKEHIENLTGQKMKYFRPPYGQFNEDTLSVLDKLDLIPFLWEVAGLDWEHKQDPEHIIHHVINYVEEGSVILLHELKQTVLILDELLTELKAEGYTFGLPPK